MPARNGDAPTGFLVVRNHNETPYFEAKWRDGSRTQRKRRLGPAWLERGADGQWVKRPGRVRPGFLDERRAHVRMAELIDEWEEELRLAPENREATFAEAAAAWLEHLANEKRAKPSTLRDYRNMLAATDAPRGPRGRRADGRSARIMRTFGDQTLAEITTADVARFLAGLDREAISARTVNKYRATLRAIFVYCMRSDTYGLKVNPAADTRSRPEGGTAPIDTFTTEELAKVAAAARTGKHHNRPEHEFSETTRAEQRRLDEQDASAMLLAGYTGLRLGELLALRWRDVDLKGSRLVVARAVSAGKEVASTKSRRHRIVPLSEQAAAELKALGRRGDFTGRDDLVLCRTDGGALDDSGLRRRFLAALDAAGVRRRRWHDLRHSFGSMAVRHFDPVAVQMMMGHSSLKTTMRYLHSKPREGDAAKLTEAFGG